ncbi:MAG TPA: hypothetical protein QF802_05050 [Candidatus Thalassarchaeaceae archaeon]|nr:hypothetical protein [Candidatus Thalassarchaeaceae archaeon]HJM19803.1 hypothetical protein [Candidatus Thalassarchaeaceae archaeon]HJM87480.1 hypothetical protein [Candidatus Thalassarchaeaceae archaeon]
MVKIQLLLDNMMTDQVLQDDAPPQSLYLLTYAVALAVTFVICVIYW